MPGGKGSVCHSTNFLRVLKRIPETVALGLLEPSELPLHRRLCNFDRFVLQHLNKSLRKPRNSVETFAQAQGRGGSSPNVASKMMATSVAPFAMSLGGGAAGGSGSGSSAATHVGANAAASDSTPNIAPSAVAGEDAGTVVERLFNIKFRTRNMFERGGHFSERESGSLVLELVYPSLDLPGEGSRSKKSGKGGG